MKTIQENTAVFAQTVIARRGIMAGGGSLLAFAVSISLISTTAQAISLGGSKSGKKFDYEACGDIVEGKTQASELDKLLKSEPVTTGKQGKLFFRSYTYTKGGGLGGIGAFGVSLGKNKAVQYRCTVTHNKAGTVFSVDMEKSDVGGSSGGF